MAENSPRRNGASISSPDNGGLPIPPIYSRYFGIQNFDDNLPENSNFPDPLASELGRLSLSTPTSQWSAYGSSLNRALSAAHQSVYDPSPAPVGVRAGSINEGPPPIIFSRASQGVYNSFANSSQPNSYANARNARYNNGSNFNGDLQSMRVQSAVRGQMGIYMQEGYQTVGIEEALNVLDLNLNDIPDHDLDNIHNLYINGCQNLVGSNRSGYGFQDSDFGLPYNYTSTRNSTRFDTNYIRRGRSYSGESCDNFSASLCNNHFSRSRPYNSFSSLEELRGNIFSVAKDQYGCRFLQKIFEGGKPEEIRIIFSEVKEYVKELMVDQFGNYLIQKMFEVCKSDQITQLLLLVINDDRSLMDVCSDPHGTRAMQKLLEHITTAEQRSLVISVLRRITVPLTKNTNGHHVIQHCLKFFTNEDNKHILNVVADNCLDIATDKSGCCVLQHCVAHAEGEPQNRLMGEITANALVLSEHPYGNYVVQYIVALKMPRVTSDVLAQLAGHFVSLSTNKYGSNVVEKCMKESSEEQAMQIIREIIRSQNFLTVLQDPYGNYVVQSAFDIAKGPIRHAMINLIQMHYSFLHSHPHGKRVLARTRGSKQRI